MPESSTVLVVGATGDLGGRAVDALPARGKRVRALVREGTDPSRLAAKGVEIARGDMLDPASLERAMSGSIAVVTTAAGYTRRRKGDSLEKVDDLGNRNLVDAAKKTGIRRFVFTSILTCDQARDVPHFWQKKLIEDYLEASGTPFVALRPGAFLGGGSARFFLRGLRKGRMMTFGSPTVRWTYVHPDDVARCLALAVDDPRAVGCRIDLGADRPVSAVELADIFTRLLGREVKPSVGSLLVLKTVGTIGGLFLPFMRDMMAMGRYFETGKYVADTKLQAELFGPVPTIEDTARRPWRISSLCLEPRDRIMRRRSGASRKWGSATTRRSSRRRTLAFGCDYRRRFSRASEDMRGWLCRERLRGTMRASKIAVLSLIGLFLIGAAAVLLLRMPKPATVNDGIG